MKRGTHVCSAPVYTATVHHRHLVVSRGTSGTLKIYFYLYFENSLVAVRTQKHIFLFCFHSECFFLTQEEKCCAVLTLQVSHRQTVCKCLEDLERCAVSCNYFTPSWTKRWLDGWMYSVLINVLGYWITLSCTVWYVSPVPEDRRFTRTWLRFWEQQQRKL